jgi:hypothetical protein
MYENIHIFIKENLDDKLENCLILEQISLDKCNFSEADYIGGLIVWDSLSITALFYVQEFNKFYIRDWVDTIDKLDYYLWFEIPVEILKKYLNGQIIERDLFLSCVNMVYYIETFAVGQGVNVYRTMGLNIDKYVKRLNHYFDMDYCLESDLRAIQQKIGEVDNNGNQ